MRVVLLTSKPTYPIVDGGCFATARLLDDLLHLNLPIIHLAHSTQKHPGDQHAYPAGLSEIHFFETNTRTSLGGFLRSFFKGTSYNLDRFRNREIKQFLENEIKSDDVLIVDSLFASMALEAKFSCAKKILRAHNVEFKIWEDYAADKKNSRLKRQILRFLSRRLKKAELDALQRFDEVWTISKEDQRSFETLGIHQCTHLPVSLESKSIERNYDSNEAFFLGSYSWGPNQEAIDYLCSIYQRIEMNSKLHLIGSKQEHLSTECIVQHGFVHELDELLEQLGFLAAPIFSGSGVKIKILESMQAGIPVLTTQLGAQGIEDKEALCIANSKEEFELLLKRLIAEKELRERYGRFAQRYTEELHSPNRVQAIIQRSISPRKV